MGRSVRDRIELAGGRARLLMLFSFIALGGALLILWAPSASATTIYVGTNLTDDAANHTWTSVQKGLNDTAADDLVFVYDGTYNETVNVTRDGVVVEGESRDGVVVNGIGAYTPTVLVSAANVTLRNFTISAGVDGLFVNGSAFAGGTLENARVVGASGYDCITIRAAAGWNLRNVTLSGCLNGVNLQQLAGAFLDGLNVSSTRADGVRADSADFVVFRNSTVSRSPGSGLNLTHSSYWTLRSVAFLNQTRQVVLALDSAFQVRYAIHDVDTSNTANGSAILWISNATGGSWSGTYAWVVLANSSNVSVAAAGTQRGFQAGLLLVGTLDSSVSGLNVNGSEWGAQMWFSHRNTIMNGTFRALTVGGIRMRDSENTTADQVTLLPAATVFPRGFSMEGTSAYGTLSNATVGDWGYGAYAEPTTRWMRIHDSNFNAAIYTSIYAIYSESKLGFEVTRNTINGSNVGVWIHATDLTGTRGVTVANNTITNASNVGIGLQICVGPVIADNFIADTPRGVQLDWGSGAIVARNRFERITPGMFTSAIAFNAFDTASGGLALNNTYSNSTGIGMSLGDAVSWTLRGNVFTQLRQPLSFGYLPQNLTDPGGSRMSFINTHDIDASNIVDGYPIRYFVNASGLSVSGTASLVIAVGCSNITGAFNNTVTDAYAGIVLVDTVGSTFSGLNVSGSKFGVLAIRSSNNTFRNITLWKNSIAAADLRDSPGSTFEGGGAVADARFAAAGILMRGASGGAFISTNITGYATAVAADASSVDTAVVGSSIRDCTLGVSLSTSFRVENSTFTNCTNAVAVNFAASAGAFRVANSTFVQVRAAAVAVIYLFGGLSLPGSSISDNLINGSQGDGIVVYGITDITVARNRVLAARGDALALFGARYASVVDNNVSGPGTGIYLVGCTGIVLSRNTVQGTDYGLQLFDSDQGTFAENTFANISIDALLLISADNNAIYHNNFFIRSGQTNVSGSSNQFDPGYPGGGNFWSNATAPDQYSGPSQNLTGSDGILDSAVLIANSSGHTDRYPLAEPWRLHLRLVSPANGSTVRVGTPVLFDIGAGFPSVEISNNSGPFAPFASPWNVSTYGMAEGPLNITIRTTTWFGYSPIRSFRFTLDSTPPTITLLSPANSTAQEPGALIQLLIADAAALNATWTAGGVPQALPSPYSIDTAGWPDGPTDVLIAARDAAGNIANATFRFVFDGSAPSVSLLSPPNGSVVEGGTLLQFVIADPHLANATLDNGSGPVPFAAPWAVSTEGWVDGRYAVAVEAVDTLGHVRHAEFILVIDSTAPVITVTSPQNGSFYPHAVAVDFTIDEPNLVEVRWRTVNGPWVSSLGPAPAYSIYTGSWGDGNWTVEINATDRVNHRTLLTFWFVIDTLPPRPPPFDPIQTYPEDAPIDFDASATTDGTNTLPLSAFAWTFAGATLAEAQGPTAAAAWATPGWFQVSLTVTDRAGNTAIARFTVIVEDTTPPEVNVVSPAVINQGESATFNASASADNDPGNATALDFEWAFRYSGASRTLKGAIATFAFAEPGLYVLTLSVTDAHGNVNATTFALRVNDVPAISPPRPVLSEFPTPLFVQLEIVDADVGDTYNVTAVSPHGLNVSVSGKTVTVRFVPSAPGNYSIRFTLSDGWAQIPANFTFIANAATTTPDGLWPGGGWTLPLILVLAIAGAVGLAVVVTLSRRRRLPEKALPVEAGSPPPLAVPPPAAPATAYAPPPEPSLVPCPTCSAPLPPWTPACPSCGTALEWG